MPKFGEDSLADLVAYAEQCKQNALAHRKEIAARLAKSHLGIETLVTRNRDSLDFHDVGVASLEAALIAAYELGQKEA